MSDIRYTPDGRLMTDEEKRRLYREYHVVERRRLKMKVLGHYGRVCACCGEGRIEFLAIDHVHGGGRQHRINIGVKAGVEFYRWLKRNGYPPGFRVLCHNCNMSLGFFGYCPHGMKMDDSQNSSDPIPVVVRAGQLEMFDEAANA